MKSDNAIANNEIFTSNLKKDTFNLFVPEFSFSVNGDAAIVRVKPVVGASGYLIVGEAPGRKKLSMALSLGITIITEGHFAKMLAESEVSQ